MARNMDTLKNEAPTIYWRAVDMARDGFSSFEIMSMITRETVALNERRARSGRSTVRLSWTGA